MRDKAGTILVAEDDDNDFFFLNRAFGKGEVRPELQRAQDGQEVIDYLNGDGEYSNRERFPFPLLLVLDLKMPRKNGFDVLRWLHEQGKPNGLIVVVLSSSAEQRDVVEAYLLGAHSYLTKPGQYEDYQALVGTLKEYWVEWNQLPAKNN